MSKLRGRGREGSRQKGREIAERGEVGEGNLICRERARDKKGVTKREGSPAVVSVMLLTASSCLCSSVLTCPIDSSPDKQAFYCRTNEVCDISATFSGHCCTLLHLDVCRANSKDWKEAFLTCWDVLPLRETPGK